MADTSQSWWQDDPIEEEAEDSFDRLSAAERMADLIVNSHSWRSSTIFGLTGPWGSGKSSLINLAANRITDQHPEWKLVRFTPWATSDAAGLLEEFYRGIAQALPPAWGSKFRRAAGNLVQVASPAANLIPLVGGVVSEAAKAGSAWLSSTPSWQAAFDRAAHELANANTPILVIADDIDRLQTDELLLFLKVIRLLGRFPGVQYLIAYDETTLFRTLAAANLVQNTESATQYMEKIVQYPISVPPLLEHQLHTRLSEGIERVRAAACRPSLGGHNWNTVLSSLLPLTRTPRAVDRYLAQVAHDLPVVAPDELNDTDLLLLIALRQQFPTVASMLPEWKQHLILGHTEEMESTHPQVTYEQTDVSPLLSGLSKSGGELAHTLLRALFPKLGGASIRRLSPIGGRHISDSQYFDRYFALGIPENDVSDATVASAVTAAQTGDDGALVHLLTSSNQQIAELVLTKVSAATSMITSPVKGLALIQAGAKVIAAMPDEGLRPGFNVRDRAVYWLSDVLGNIGTGLSVETVRAAVSPLEALDVIRILDGARRQHPTDVWDWEKPFTKELVSAISEAFVANVLQRDQAPEERILTMLTVVAEQHGLGSIRQQLDAALAEGIIALEDVAARFVVSAMAPGDTDWTLHSVEQSLWSALGVGSSNDAWFSKPLLPDVDRSSVTWVSRRHFAQGRLRAASPTAAPEPGQSSGPETQDA